LSSCHINYIESQSFSSTKETKFKPHVKMNDDDSPSPFSISDKCNPLDDNINASMDLIEDTALTNTYDWNSTLKEAEDMRTNIAVLYSNNETGESSLSEKQYVDGLSRLIETIEKLWLHVPLSISSGGREGTLVDYGKAMFGFMKLDLANVDQDKVQHSFANEEKNLVKLSQMILGLNGYDDLKKHVNDDFRRIFRVMVEVKRQLCNAVYSRQLLTIDSIYLQPLHHALDSCTFLEDNYQELEGIAKLITFVAQNIERHHLKRFKDMCYKQCYITCENTGKVCGTKHWREYCTIKEFIHRICPKETQFDMWHILISIRDIDTRIVNKFMMNTEREFPELQIDRHLFSFKNGLFHCEKQRFYRYDEEDDIARDLPECAASINFFENIYCFNDGEVQDPSAIPTPHLDSIFQFQLRHAFKKDRKIKMDELDAEYKSGKLSQEDYQVKAEELEDEIQYQKDLILWWIYAMFGRMFFELGVHDKWQVCPFIKGQAGTGKGTLGCLLAQIFPPQYVANIPSNIESQFGLQNMYDKLLWFCLEVKENFRLNLSDLQSMISGEFVTVAIKQKESKTMIWKSPGMLFGNEIPPWKDKAGALLRRFVMILFDVPVTEQEKNLGLPQLLTMELGAIIPKVTQTYLSATNYCKNDDLWKHLPKWFQECRSNFAETVDIVARFFRDSGMVEVNSECYMKEDDLILYFRKWAETSAPIHKSVAWNDDTYGTFYLRNSIVVENMQMYYNGSVEFGKYVIGVKDCKNPHMNTDAYGIN